MLTLNPRIDFGGQQWQPPVASFDLAWLKSQFHPAQVSRRDRVIAAIQSGEARVEKARKDAVGSVPVIGDVRPNGSVYRSAAHQQLQAAAKSVADAQVVNQIRAIRTEIDSLVLADLQNMERASLAAKTLSERAFSQIACLGRVNMTGWTTADLVAYKANYASLIRGIAAIELHRIAQGCLDDGSPLALIQLDVIRVENFSRKKDDRPFHNATLLDLINVPEFNAAVGTESQPGLLRQVISLHREAGAAWAGFLGRVGQASIQRIARGLSDRKLDTTSIPIDGAE